MFVDEFVCRSWHFVVSRFIVIVYSTAAFLLTIAVPTTALAQWETNRATARSLAAEGYTALKSENFAEAEDRFRRADTLVHAPTLVVDQARALVGLGRYVEAQERLELVLREGVADNSSPVWKRSLLVFLQKRSDLASKCPDASNCISGISSCGTDLAWNNQQLQCHTYRICPDDLRVAFILRFNV